MPYKSVRALLGKKERWCQGALAVDKFGYSTMPGDSDVARWCLVGAVREIYEGRIDKQSKIFRKIEERLNKGIAVWNDDHIRTHEEVLALARELKI